MHFKGMFQLDSGAIMGFDCVSNKESVLLIL